MKLASGVVTHWATSRGIGNLFIILSWNLQSYVYKLITLANCYQYLEIFTTQTQSQLNSKIGFVMKMTLDHHHHQPPSTTGNSMPAISYLWLTRFGPTLKVGLWDKTKTKTTISSTSLTTTTTTTQKQQQQQQQMHLSYYCPWPKKVGFVLWSVSPSN